MNPKDIINAVGEFIAERFPVSKMNYNSMVKNKEVPIHKFSFAYYFGGLSLLSFGIQIITGLLLVFYYQPTVSEAHYSVEYISKYVRGGFLIRNMHAWASSFMIGCVMLHLLTTFAMKAFEKPREITWLTGCLLLGIVFGFGFTGYLLPWHQIAVNATKIGLQMIETVGSYLPGVFAKIPILIKDIIQGDAAIGQSTLSRFYAIHAIILPLAIAFILGIHLFSVQLHGMSKGVDEEPKRMEKFFPFFIIKDLSVWGVAFMALFVVSLCLPFESLYPYPLFEPYQARGSTPEGIKPEWYFYWMYYPLELLPFWMVMLGMVILTMVLLGAPLIFKGTNRKTLRIIAAFAAGYLVVITLFGEKIYKLFKG
ncbi:MAG: cytochrome b [Limisphaerales bacterium]